MRSSIACVRCRRSKVKCVNTGPNTTCRACEASNRECTYPPPVSSGTPRAAHQGAAMHLASSAASSVLSGAATTSAPGVGGAPGFTSANVDRGEAPKKAKPKKPAPSTAAAATAASMHTPKAWRECLESPALTPAVWQQIFDHFQLHSSPTLPFLHPPTFMTRLRAATASASASSTSPPAPEKPHSPVLLLGLLALTARHIPTLVLHHAPVLPNAAAVSEYYATALKFRLRTDDDDSFVQPGLEKVQALLMLAMHEWGMARIAEAYVWLGLAIRMAGALGLSWVDAGEAPPPQYPPFSASESLEGPDTKRRKLDNGAPTRPSGQEVVEREVRRRTFWAVFMLDRALSYTRTTPSGVTAADAYRVRLPCEDKGFLFGEDVRTGYLAPGKEDMRNGDSPRRRELGDEEGVLARLVRITHIWWQVQTWVESGGLRADGTSPLSPESTYYQLALALKDFEDSLPRHLQFSPQHLNAHMSSRSSSEYVQMHIVLFLSHSLLQRELLPVVPLPPTSHSADTRSLHEGAASTLYASARGIITLLTYLGEWGAQQHIESPLIIEGLKVATQAALYAHEFPWMDPARRLVAVDDDAAEPRRAIELLNRMKPRWRTAQDALRTLQELKMYFEQHKSRFLRENPLAAEAVLTPPSDEARRFLALLNPPPPAMTTLQQAKSHPHQQSSQPIVKQEHHGHSHGHHHSLSSSSAGGARKTPSSEPDTAASSMLAVNTSPIAPPAPAPPTQAERWAAVNTHPHPPPQPQQVVSALPTPPPQRSQATASNVPGTEFLDQLAGFAAQRGKIDHQDVKPEDLAMGGLESTGSAGHGGGSSSLGDAEGDEENGRWIENEVERGGAGAGSWPMVAGLEG